MRPSQEAPRVRHRWIRVLFVVVGAIVAWWILDATRTRASWLELFGSPRLVAGHEAKFVVHLSPGLGEGVVTLDLHWRTRQRVDRRVLLTGRPSKIDETRRDHVFDFILPSNPDLGAVIAVVYVGPSGRWTERSRAAFSEPLEVAPPGTAGVDESNTETTTKLRRLPVFVPEPTILPPLERSRVIRYFAATLLLLSAVGLAWRLGLWGARTSINSRIGPKNQDGLVGRDLPPSSRTRDFGETGRARRCGDAALGGAIALPMDGGGSSNGRWDWIRANGLAMLLFTLALGEITGVANWLTQRSRAFAKANQLYAFRQDFQRPLTVFLVAIGIGWMVWVFQSPMPRAIRTVWIGCLGYLLVSLAGALSLHEFDALMVRSMVGATLFEWGKILASALALAGVAGCLRDRRSTETG